MVREDAVRDLLEQDRLAGSGRGDDETALALTDRRHEIDDAHVDLVGGRLQLDAPLRMQRRQVVEADLLAESVGILVVDRLDAEQGEVALVLLGRPDLPSDDGSRLQAEAANLARRNVDIVWAGEVIVVRTAEEAEAVRQNLQGALAEHQAVLLDPLLEDLEDQVLLFEPRVLRDPLAFGGADQLRHRHLLKLGEMDLTALDVFVTIVNLGVAKNVFVLVLHEHRRAAVPNVLVPVQGWEHFEIEIHVQILGDGPDRLPLAFAIPIAGRSIARAVGLCIAVRVRRLALGTIAGEAIPKRHARFAIAAATRGEWPRFPVVRPRRLTITITILITVGPVAIHGRRAGSIVSVDHGVIVVLRRDGFRRGGLAGARRVGWLPAGASFMRHIDPISSQDGHRKLFGASSRRGSNDTIASDNEGSKATRREMDFTRGPGQEGKKSRNSSITHVDEFSALASDPARVREGRLRALSLI